MEYAPKNGFSLVELLVAMAVTSIVMVAIVATYIGQVRSKNTQEILTDMNQTARAALEIMTHEIRMAGLDPTQDADAQITTAGVGELIFSLDRRSNSAPINKPNGDCCDGNEQIRYHLSPAARDSNDDGVNDNITEGVECNLGRETGSGLITALGCGGGTSNLQAMARNVDALNFVYLTDDNDGDGAPDVLATPVATQALRDTIRAVQVTLVARAGTESRGFLNAYTDNNAYFNLQGQQILPLTAGNVMNDGFRRIRLATTIACRNVGF